ncbi:MAG TPA: D-cysteine desulfhydrase family protein [Ignavibacteria bacterium]
MKTKDKFPSLMTIAPTPVQFLENIKNDFGYNVFCKRDDLTGFAFGGNKTRKLDYLIYDAIEKGSDTLIGVGAVQSNFCRLTAAMGRKAGLKVELVLGGKKPKKPTANYLLDILFGANLNYVESEDWNKWETEAKQLETDLRKKGKKPYFMPIGGSSPVGALGYVEAFYEIYDDQKYLDVEFNVIIHATASAGTQSGLIVGAAVKDWTGKIIGIGVAKSSKQISGEVYELANKTAQPMKIKIEKKKIIVTNDYMGKGYADLTKDCVKAVEYFARNEGIMLDYVYSGKAAAGLLDMLKNKRFRKNINILFIHTGGNVGLFR